jgi:HlyD family secretion protein
MKKKITYWSLGGLVVAGIGFFAVNGFSKKEEVSSITEIRVKRGSITDKVLAVGTIEPEKEIQVKSQVSGVVAKIFHDEGDFVHKGDPLIEVKPAPTPREISDVAQEIELAKNDVGILGRDKERLEGLKAKGMVAAQEYERALQLYNAATLRLKTGQDRLELLKSGRVSAGGKQYESIVRAEMDGYILQKVVNVGDPVVAQSSFQAGVTLMTLADMKTLIFKGTVDEINVGRVKVGMPIVMKIGALPNTEIKATVSEIGLKAQKKDNTTTFDIKATIAKEFLAQLRAGYSANAEIIIQKKEGILTLPERVIVMRGDSSFVLMPAKSKDEKPSEKYIKTGLSDAITIEILSGIQDGMVVAEPPMKKIEN